MVREGNVDIFCEGAAYSRLQSTNREVSVEVMKEYFQRAGRGREELTYLDLFCGSGIRALLFCDAFPRHGKVVGVDNDPKCVENAIHNAVINQVRSVEFHCQDVLSFLGDACHPLISLIWIPLEDVCPILSMLFPISRMEDCWLSPSLIHVSSFLPPAATHPIRPTGSRALIPTLERMNSG
jgi:SAM-dependent methyltransferase